MITTVTEFPGLVCFSGQWQAGASFGDTLFTLTWLWCSSLAIAITLTVPEGLTQKGLQNTLQMEREGKDKVHLEYSGSLEPKNVQISSPQQQS